MHAFDRQTDRQTDRRSDRRTDGDRNPIAIPRLHSMQRGKKTFHWKHCETKDVVHKKNKFDKVKRLTEDTKT